MLQQFLPAILVCTITARNLWSSNGTNSPQQNPPYRKVRDTLHVLRMSAIVQFACTPTRPVSRSTPS